MNISISRKYRLTSDSRQFVIREYIGVSKEGEPVYTPRFYYTNLQDAILGIFRHVLRTSKAKDLQGVLDRIEQAETRLIEICERIENG